jgi:prepilin-type N-terminal cleavage/methylation domain-containing protein
MARGGGFTLIELLVVIAILSTVTLLAFNVSTDDRAQLRYNDTRARLQALERAILGRLGPADAAAVGGFAADNGRLPASVAELLSAEGLAAQAALAPVFDPTPDASSTASACFNDGGPGETTLDDAVDATGAPLLVKGHRGNYLGGLAFNKRFRDGWGNEGGAADALNFGWALDAAVTHSLKIASLGVDNLVGGDDYAADVSATIQPGDWRVPLGGWTVRVRVHNRSGSDIPATPTANIHLSASLLVFVNDTSGGKWRQFSSNTATVSCLDGDGDGLVSDGASGTVSCDASASVDLIFPETQCSGLSSIPQGRHLLVLVKRKSASGTNTDDAPYTWNDGATDRPIVTQITAVAGMTLPETHFKLEIR